jgi:hypothetical protein
MLPMFTAHISLTTITLAETGFSAGAASLGTTDTCTPGCGQCIEVSPGVWRATCVNRLCELRTSFCAKAHMRRMCPRSVLAHVSAGAKIPIVPVENSPTPQAGGVNPDSGNQRRVKSCLGAKTWKKSIS